MTFTSRFGNLIVEDEPLYKSEVYDVPSSNLNAIITSSTQWSKTLPAPVNLPNGSTANGFTFFDNVADKIADGTTSYNEFNIAFGITITLSGAVVASEQSPI